MLDFFAGLIRENALPAVRKAGVSSFEFGKIVHGLPRISGNQRRSMLMPNLKLATMIGLLTASTAMLADAAWGNSHNMGTPDGRKISADANPAATTIISAKPIATFPSAGYAAGGVALRNRSEGVINISGLTGKVRRAYLYFAYLYSATPPASLPITITRLFPGAHSSVLSAKLIAHSGDPCWGSSGGAIYRAIVPLSTATGNGEYRIQPDASVVGLNTGEDPWDGNVVLPLDEGASLVLIGDGSHVVDVFDSGMSGKEFQSTFTYKLHLSSAAGSSVLMDSIGADGQTGNANRQDNAAGFDPVTVNGVQISGSGSTITTDDDWNGSAGWPSPEMWDNVGHDISGAAAGATTLTVTVVPQDDCLITVANVVAH